MPRKRKSLPTADEIEAFARVMPILVVIGIGTFIIFSITIWLNSLKIPSEFTCTLVIFAFLALFIGTPVVFYTLYNKATTEKYKGLRIANIDSMTGIEFEQYLQKLLANQGYSVSVTQASGDLGVDLVASRDGDKIAIQAKRYSTNVSRRAISDAVAGMYHYNCNKAMVVTNSYFSPGAKELAESTECILIDRDTLARWINEFQNIGKVNQNRA
jgi:restriction system protein